MNVHVNAATPDTAAAVAHAVGRCKALQRVPLFTLMATFQQQAAAGLHISGLSEGSSAGSSGGTGLHGGGEEEALLPFNAACVHNSAGISWVAVNSTKPVSR